MAEFPRDYQILVADDASTDKTSEVLTPYARVLPLTVVRTDKRRGYAASLEMLLREAVRRSEYPKRDVIITIQADFSQEPEDIVPIIKAMEAGADIVCGESTLPAETAWKIRWSRRMAARVLKRKSVPQGVKDPFTGFRGYRVFTVKKAMEAKSDGRLLVHDSWAANAELLAATAAHARRIDPIDVTVRPHRLQRASRLLPWNALKNVWSYARRAQPTIEMVSVAELDDSVSSVASSRRNDAAAVRERMSERSDMHGNRSPHGDRQPHNARTERVRPSRGGSGGGRDRNTTDRPRAERPRSPDRQRTNGDAPRAERPRTERPPRQERPATPAAANGEVTERKERTPRNRGRNRQNGDRNAVPVAGAETVAPETVLDPNAVIEANVDGAEADAAAEPAKRRRRRGRRSRGGAKRNNNGVAGDVTTDGSDAGVDAVQDDGDAGDVSADATDESAIAVSGDGTPARKRRRGRRGGRGRRRQGAAGATEASAEGDAGDGMGSAGDPAVETVREAQPFVREDVSDA